MTAAIDLAWWALAALEVLGGVWLVVLAVGFLRIWGELRDLRAAEARDERATSARTSSLEEDS